jgi:hypothetical protein
MIYKALVDIETDRDYINAGQVINVYRVISHNKLSCSQEINKNSQNLTICYERFGNKDDEDLYEMPASLLLFCKKVKLPFLTLLNLRLIQHLTMNL